MAKKKKNAPLLAVLNLKGGVGKTTTTAHVFRVFFERLRQSTLLIDLDPQFNLTQTLFTRQVYEQLRDEDNTILAAMEALPAVNLFEVNTAKTPPPDPHKLSKVLWSFKGKLKKSLSIVPGDFRLVKYSLMDDNKKLNAIRTRFNLFTEQCRSSFDITCIDCNPSSSFLTLCALRACSHILVPVRPDRYSILGLELLHEFVTNLPTINPKPEFIVLLNGIPRTNYDRTVENELRAHPYFGTRTLAARIHHSRILLASPSYTGFATDKKVPYRHQLSSEISDVVDEIATRIGMAP